MLTINAFGKLFPNVNTNKLNSYMLRQNDNTLDNSQHKDNNCNSNF